MDLGLKGKTAIVGASSQGLGFACAKALAQEGVKVVLSGRTAQTLQAAHDEIAKIGAVHSVVADLATQEGRSAVLSGAREAFGAVDILITNTGGPPPGPFEAHNLSAWEATYRLLLESAVAMIQGVLPDMKAQKWGRIIAITSSAVKQPVDGLILSNAVRASLAGLCKTLANELGPDNITVNNLMPGFTQTNRIAELLKDETAVARIVENIPLRRIGDPDDFGAVAAFLASEQAGFISGASIPVDGGAVKGLL